MEYARIITVVLAIAMPGLAWASESPEPISFGGSGCDLKRVDPNYRDRLLQQRTDADAGPLEPLSIEETRMVLTSVGRKEERVLSDTMLSVLSELPQKNAKLQTRFCGLVCEQRFTNACFIIAACIDGVIGDALGGSQAPVCQVGWLFVDHELRDRCGCPS